MASGTNVVNMVLKWWCLERGQKYGWASKNCNALFKNIFLSKFWLFGTKKDTIHISHAGQQLLLLRRYCPFGRWHLLQCEMFQDGRRLKRPSGKNDGLDRDLNPGPLAPEARIIPLDHQATYVKCGFYNYIYLNSKANPYCKRWCEIKKQTIFCLIVTQLEFSLVFILLVFRSS